MQGEVLADKIVPSSAGSFQLPITINETTRLVWRVRSVSDWLHVPDQNWKQNAYNVTINYDSNESSAYVRNFARAGAVVIETYDGFVADTIVVKQRGITPNMHLKDVEVDASVAECEIEFNSNLTDTCRPNMTFSADADWVTSVEYLGCGTHLLVKFSPNEGEARTAEIKVAFTDACGVTSEAKCVLTQSKALE